MQLAAGSVDRVFRIIILDNMSFRLHILVVKHVDQHQNLSAFRTSADQLMNLHLLSPSGALDPVCLKPPTVILLPGNLTVHVVVP